jgi:RNA polymerase sigma-70 factor (ECF subfamily)
LRDLDTQLMQRAGEGDRAAWRALYLRHKDRVFGIARRYLGVDASARDVTQEVFIALFAHAKRYRPSGNFLGFLRRLTVNRCINLRAEAFASRREPGAHEVLLQVADEHPDPERRMEQEQAAAAVHAALAALPPRQRMAVVLSRFEGLSYQEVAVALDCSVSSVESLLFRARQALARTLSG